MQNSTRNWVIVAVVIGALATIQMAAATGDLATQLIMFPFYTLIYGGIVAGIGIAIQKMRSGRKKD